MTNAERDRSRPAINFKPAPTNPIAARTLALAALATAWPALALAQDRGTEAQCSGILHDWREDNGGIGFGGGYGEDEGICIIGKSEERKVLAVCSIHQFCRVKGLQKACKDSGECGEMTIVYSVTR